jgi:hypothetical protein
VTSPDTVKDVFHLADTRSRSRKKNTVEATKAMEINQNVMPTKSSGLSVSVEAAAAWVLNKARIKPEVAMVLVNLMIMIDP